MRSSAAPNSKTRSTPLASRSRGPTTAPARHKVPTPRDGRPQDLVPVPLHKQRRSEHEHVEHDEPLLPDNTSDNTPGSDYELVPKDRVRIAVLVKGFGAEMTSALRMFPATAGKEAVKQFVAGGRGRGFAGPTHPPGSPRGLRGPGYGGRVGAGVRPLPRLGGERRPRSGLVYLLTGSVCPALTLLRFAGGRARAVRVLSGSVLAGAGRAGCVPRGVRVGHDGGRLPGSPHPPGVRRCGARRGGGLRDPGRDLPLRWQRRAEEEPLLGPVPALGQHTEAVLRELGLAQEGES